jgi:hypothetical protein
MSNAARAPVDETTRSVGSGNSVTLLITSATACPRCEGPRIEDLARNTESSFVWQECLDCGHLWGIPRECTSHSDAAFAPPPNQAR